MSELVEIQLGAIQMGQAQAKVDEALKRIAEDVVARPSLKKPRTVSLLISITPDQDSEGKTNLPNIDWSVSWRVPGSRGLVTRGYVEDGKLKVNKNDPNAAQRTIFDDEEPGKVVPLMKGEVNK